MDKKIQKLIEKVKKDPMVLAVALFGSYARKEKYNDIDICLFLKPKKYNENILSKKRLSYMFDDEKYDLQIFQQLPLYVQKRILKDAKILYTNNEDALYDLYFKTIKDFENFRVYYENYLQGVANG